MCMGMYWFRFAIPVEATHVCMCMCMYLCAYVLTVNGFKCAKAYLLTLRAHNGHRSPRLKSSDGLYFHKGQGPTGVNGAWGPACAQSIEKRRTWWGARTAIDGPSRHWTKKGASKTCHRWQKYWETVCNIDNSILRKRGEKGPSGQFYTFSLCYLHHPCGREEKGEIPGAALQLQKEWKSLYKKQFSDFRGAKNETPQIEKWVRILVK